MKNKQITGIMWMVLHCFLISVLSAMVRDISGGYHILQIVFMHNIVAFILVVMFILVGGDLGCFNTGTLRLHLIRAVLGYISLAMYFYAFTVMPLTSARAIALAGPLVSALFAVLFLKEKIGIHRSLALVIGFAGALVILRPGNEGFNYASFFVIAAIFMWSIIDIIMKIISKTERTLSQLFYLMGLMSLFSLPAAAYFWQTPQAPIDYIKLFALGIIFLINCLAIYNAFKNSDVTIIVPFDFSGMVFTTIIAYLLFDEVIDIWTAFGSVVIVISSVYIVRREAKKHKEAHAAILQNEV